MPLNRILILLMSTLLIVLAGPVSAQEADTTLDPWSLARRLLGYEADFAIPPPTPLYSLGDGAEFWVGKATADTPTRITARLAAATSRVYLWVEEGLSYNSSAMQSMAQQIDQTFGALRLRSNYGQPSIIPFVGAVPDPTSMLPVPDVDADPHLFILYASDLGQQAYIFNPYDSLPTEIAPGGYSNQHELIAINASMFPNAPLDNAGYLTILTQAMYELLAYQHTPDQDQWLKEALGTLFTRLLELPQIRPNAATSFVQLPNNMLTAPLSSTGSDATEGGQQVFLDYMLQRFGFQLVQNLFQQPGPGLQPLDAALQATGSIDPITGEVATANQLFADFVAANITSYVVDQLFGDGRYLHQAAALPETTPPAGFIFDGSLNGSLQDLAVVQYGTRYIYVAHPQPSTFTFSFEGQPTTPLLRLPPDADPENRFYWSGRGQNQDVMLTRAFDLRDTDSATLTFDLWYDLPPARNYAYVAVSVDEGATWDLLAGDLSSTQNRFGLAYGPGYTGISSHQDPTPFPIIGVVLDTDGLTVMEIAPDGPASQSDLQAGDVIIGYDGRTWPGVADVIGLLENYDPGDTLDLFVRRGQEQLSIPVVLGAHPTRVKLPAPEWVTQEIDLSAYAGQEILLRFEYISQAQGGGFGAAVDNIAIPEIDYLDDAETSSDWTLHGWQQVSNQVPQNFLVQYISSGTEQRLPRVRQLIGPEDDATSGEWRFNLEPGEIVAFTISGLNDDTLLPAQFSFALADVSAEQRDF